MNGTIPVQFPCHLRRRVGNSAWPQVAFWALVLAFLAAANVRAEDPPASEAKGPYLGVLYSPIPEALLDHLPQLPKEGGVMITHVLPDSPADKAGLRRHDLLTQFGDLKIRDANHFARLIQASKTGQSVQLTLVRRGVETTLDVKIALGPVLRIARDEDSKDPGVAKPGGPAPLSVTATPMEGNKMSVTFEYSEAGRIKSLTCMGGIEEIDREIDKLPMKVQKMARVAVQKLRSYNLQMSDPKKPG